MKTYDFKKITCIFGPVTLSGFAEGDGISLEPEEDIYKVKKGCDGQTTRSRTNNDDFSGTIKFMATSDSKAQFQDLTLRNAALSTLTYPFRLESPATGETIASANAFVMRLPNFDYGQEVGEREYKIYLPDCTVSLKEVLGSILGFLG